MVHQRIKTNDELNILIKNKNITNYINAKRLSWFGHVCRMAKYSMVKKLYRWKPTTTRLAGRSKTKWENNMKKYLRIIKTNNWTKRILDHAKWMEVVEKAKTLTQ